METCIKISVWERNYCLYSQFNHRTEGHLIGLLCVRTDAALVQHSFLPDTEVSLFQCQLHHTLPAKNITGPSTPAQIWFCAWLDMSRETPHSWNWLIGSVSFTPAQQCSAVTNTAGPPNVSLFSAIWIHQYYSCNPNPMEHLDSQWAIRDEQNETLNELNSIHFRRI